jgi:hypothetical protein
MDIERLCLEAGEAIGDDLEPLAYGVEMIKTLLQAEVVQIVGDQFVAQKAGELFVLLCVQRRLACSVGSSPESHRGKSQKPRSLDSRKEGN